MSSWARTWPVKAAAHALTPFSPSALSLRLSLLSVHEVRASDTMRSAPRASSSCMGESQGSGSREEGEGSGSREEGGGSASCRGALELGVHACHPKGPRGLFQARGAALMHACMRSCV
jgi:hypothetical protein